MTNEIAEEIMRAWGEPGNKRDRARFARLSEKEQWHVRVWADRLYDENRTVARCWREALDNYGA